MTRTRSAKMFAAVLAIVCMVALTPIFAFPVSVDAASALTVSDNYVVVEKGKTVKLTSNKKANWKVVDKKIAKVSKKKSKTNYVKGVSEGVTTLKVSYGKQCFEVTVDVFENASMTGNYRADSYTGGVIYQESAEVAAQQIQTFKLAKYALDEKIAANDGTGEGLGICTDIDATLMDDSTYFAGALTDAKNRAALDLEPWNNDDWCGYYAAVATEADTAIPGAREFLEYAYDKGVTIYYITNRPYYELDLTVAQLEHAFGDVIPDGTFDKYDVLSDPKYSEIYDYDYVADDASAELKEFQQAVNESGVGLNMGGYHFSADDYLVQVQGTYYSSDKAQRRANAATALAAKYPDKETKIVMCVGDSINDSVSKNEYKLGVYSDINETDWANNNITGKPAYRSFDFDRTNGNINRTAAALDDYWYDKWGTEFIVLPNSAYGDWQKATWFKQSLTRAGQNAATLEQLAFYSYLNSDTWYDGPSPIGADIQ